MFELEILSCFGIILWYGDSKEVCWFEILVCFVWYIFNVYEEEDEIVLFVCWMNLINVFVINESDCFFDGDIFYLYCWWFNLKIGGVKEEKLDDVVFEFFCVNEKLLGWKVWYGYLVRMEVVESIFVFDVLIKYDLDIGKLKIYEFGKGCYGGEVVFVFWFNVNKEDDGWLLIYVYDENI